MAQFVSLDNMAYCGFSKQSFLKSSAMLKGVSKCEWTDWIVFSAGLIPKKDQSLASKGRIVIGHEPQLTLSKINH
jgi:hypothetical protein